MAESENVFADDVTPALGPRSVRRCPTGRQTRQRHRASLQSAAGQGRGEMRRHVFIRFISSITYLKYYMITSPIASIFLKMSPLT